MLRRINSEDEFEEISSKVEKLIELNPDPESEEGFKILRLLECLDEYEEQNHSRIQGWICQMCHRSYNPDIELCSFCEEQFAFKPPTQEEIKAHNELRLDMLLRDDRIFSNKGC